MRASLLQGLRRVIIPFRYSLISSAYPVARSRVRPPPSHAFRSLSRRIPDGFRYFSSSRRLQFSLDGESTIYALSTAPGRAAIAVVRVSGPACVQIYQALCPSKLLPKARVAAVRTLYDPTQNPTENSVLDSGALVLYFPGPKTVTGEDVLELHLHGGPAIVKSVLAAIASINGTDRLVRYAEAGEFTHRAFLNNRLDLPQIEALGDSLAADTERQRRLAVRGTSDNLAKRYEMWRQQLLYARGELEALIDFAEDQDFEESSDELITSVASQVHALQVQIGFHIQNASKGELLRNGIKIALLGAPNAGKSSLLNRIVGNEAAIVSTEEGTTRDIVDVGVDLGGWYCKLGDMAGIRSESTDPAKGALVIGAVEKEGIRRARARALDSDVVIVVVALENGLNGEPYRLSVEPEVVAAVNDCVQAGKCLVVAFNKCDRMPEAIQDDRLPQELAEVAATLFPSIGKPRLFAISCQEALKESSPNQQDPGNLQKFLQGLIATFEEIASPLGIEGDEQGKYDISYWEDSLSVTHRQSSNLQRCVQHLTDFLNQTSKTETSKTPGYEYGYIEGNVDIVTAAEYLRRAADTLAKITGKGESGDVEDVLGVVFEKFCVGK